MEVICTTAVHRPARLHRVGPKKSARSPPRFSRAPVTDGPAAGAANFADMDPATTAWLEGNARRVVDAQLGEAARVNSRARELVGFVGIILGLLATAASQSAAADGVWGGLFRFLTIAAVAALLWSALHVLQKLVLARPQLRDIGAGALGSYRDDPALAGLEPEALQARAFYDLTAAAEANAPLIERAHDDFAAGYGYFAIGLFAAGLAIVALVLALI